MAHPPIHIVGDGGVQGFVLVPGTPSYRPGSGVVSGMGTMEDPYLIEGWCIVSTGSGAGIRMEDTRAHVVVRDNWITGPPTGTSGGFGVLTDNVSGMSLSGNVIERHARGVQLMGSSGPNAIEGNTVRHNLNGIMLWSSPGTVVRDNLVEDHTFSGVWMVESPQSVVDGNTIRGSGDMGVTVANDSTGTVVSGNTIRHNQEAGVLVSRSRDVSVLENSIRVNGWEGVRVVAASQGTVVHDNNFVLNGVGLVNFESFAVDATDNYWGCEQGPAHAWCDSVSGNVDVDPYRSSPNPDAGA